MEPETHLFDSVLRVVARTTGTDLSDRLYVPLFEAGLLDSMTAIALMVALSDEFGLALSPADVERADWATPRLIIADMRRRVRAGAPRRTRR
jgi:D-alanine--poly(phosphoribitol) ligase subunit 2